MAKPIHPERRLGIYKSLEEVPDEYRLYQHADGFEGRDMWAEWIRHREETEGLADSTKGRLARAEESWKAHMADRGRHHALATPVDVETWCEACLDRMTRSTLYNRYYGAVATFYEWMLWDFEYPHRYLPTLMAVLEGGAAYDAYCERLTLGSGRPDRNVEAEIDL